jgi:hypothetical protein
MGRSKGRFFCLSSVLIGTLTPTLNPTTALATTVNSSGGIMRPSERWGPLRPLLALSARDPPPAFNLTLPPLLLPLLPRPRLRFPAKPSAPEALMARMESPSGSCWIGVGENIVAFTIHHALLTVSLRLLLPCPNSKGCVRVLGFHAIRGTNSKSVNNLSACPYGDGSQKIPDENPRPGASSVRRAATIMRRTTRTGGTGAAVCFSLLVSANRKSFAELSVKVSIVVSQVVRKLT